MPQLFGGIEVLDEVETLTGNVRVLGATAYLRRLYQALDEAGYGDRIMIDLGLVHEMDYYTGIMFRGYIGGAGAAIRRRPLQRAVREVRQGSPGGRLRY